MQNNIEIGNVRLEGWPALLVFISALVIYHAAWLVAGILLGWAIL